MIMTAPYAKHFPKMFPKAYKKVTENDTHHRVLADFNRCIYLISNCPKQISKNDSKFLIKCHISAYFKITKVKI